MFPLQELGISDIFLLICLSDLCSDRKKTQVLNVAIKQIWYHKSGNDLYNSDGLYIKIKSVTVKAAAKM